MNGRDLLAFADENIRLNEKGKPWRFSEHQRAVISLMWDRDYAIRLWSEPKKSGKTFLAACAAIAEAVMSPDTEVVIYSNDLQQAIGRVFQTCVGVIKYNAELAASTTVQSSVIKLTNGSSIKAVSCDYRGEAGGRQRLSVFDELWGYNRETLTRLFEECTPPPTEPGAYILIVSYAGFTGESELLEKLYHRGLKGKRISRKYEVHRADGLCMFWSHKGRQPWQLGAEGRKYYAEQRRILRPGSFKRLHQNEWISSESAFILAEMWDAVVDDSVTPVLSGATLFVGLDVGIKSDNAARVAVRWHEDRTRLVIASHKVWKPTKAQPVALADIQTDIEQLAKLNRIAKVFCDPYQAMQIIQALQPKIGRTVVCEYAQTVANTVTMGENLFSLIRDKNLISYPSDDLRAHVLNAVGLETPRGVRMVKSTGSRKIDLGIALAMACVAALEAGVGASASDMFSFTSPEKVAWNRFAAEMDHNQFHDNFDLWGE